MLTDKQTFKRHPAIAKRQNSVLIVVDCQEKLLPFVFNYEKTTKNICTLIEFAKIMKIPIVLTEHYPKGLGTTVKEIKNCLAEYKPIEKTIFSCFGSQEFEDKLKELKAKNLIFCGIESHICISQSVLDAIGRNYKVHVVKDAISSRTEENLKIGMKKMKINGAIISSTEMVMYEIIERANTKEFKEVLKLLKQIK